MEKLIIAIVVIIVLGISIVLFSKTSGTLNPGKLNIVSYVFYIFMLQSFVGASLIALGFDQHYTLTYLLDAEKSIMTTVIMVWLTAILLPLFILIWQKVFRYNAKEVYSKFLSSRVEKVKRSKELESLFSIGVVVCLIISAGYLRQVGYIPILKLFSAPEGFSFATERVRISNISFIHPYISNITLFTIVPLMTYISFSYALSYKTGLWRMLFIICFVMSCICKTYKFEKTPLIFHFVIFVLIYIFYKGGIKFIHMVLFGMNLVLLLLLSYVATGYEGNLLDIYNGPLGRTFFTEVGTLSYHFDLFPEVFGYLHGRSFSPSILTILGIGAERHIRSAKLVMAFYGSEKVYDGIAGVMNTLFIGEAYANWGCLGVMFGIVWVAFVISFFMWIVVKMKKTPSSMTLLAVMSVRMGSMLEGGFCDFVYSFDILFTSIALISVYILFESSNNFKERNKHIRLNRRKGKQDV